MAEQGAALAARRAAARVAAVAGASSLRAHLPVCGLDSLSLLVFESVVRNCSKIRNRINFDIYLQAGPIPFTSCETEPDRTAT